MLTNLACENLRKRKSSAGPSVTLTRAWSAYLLLNFCRPFLRGVKRAFDDNVHPNCTPESFNLSFLQWFAVSAESERNKFWGHLRWRWNGLRIKMCEKQFLSFSLESKEVQSSFFAWISLRSVFWAQRSLRGALAQFNFAITAGLEKLSANLKPETKWIPSNYGETKSVII